MWMAKAVTSRTVLVLRATATDDVGHCELDEARRTLSDSWHTQEACLVHLAASYCISDHRIVGAVDNDAWVG